MKLENLGFMPRRVFPHVEISSFGCFPRTETGIPRSPQYYTIVSMNMCVYGNEMCVYVAHERSLATRAGWVLSTLTDDATEPNGTLSDLPRHSSERGDSV